MIDPELRLIAADLVEALQAHAVATSRAPMSVEIRLDASNNMLAIADRIRGRVVDDESQWARENPNFSHEEFARQQRVIEAWRAFCRREPGSPDRLRDLGEPV